MFEEEFHGNVLWMGVLGCVTKHKQMNLQMNYKWVDPWMIK